MRVTISETYLNTYLTQITLADRQWGSRNSDTLRGTSRSDYLEGQGGPDVIYGNGGNDYIIGDTTIFIFDGPGPERDGDARLIKIGLESVYGEARPVAELVWDAGGDRLYGGGNDFLAGGLGDDLLMGETGNDVLIGDGLEFESIRGARDLTTPARFIGEGNDVLIGGPGHDYLHSGGGVNLLDGGPGNDTLVSESDREALAYDVLIGGAGRDVFDVQDQATAVVKIMDFEPGQDAVKIDDGDSLIDIYRLVEQANIAWNWAWFADEGSDGVDILLDDGVQLSLDGIAIDDLQTFHFAGGDVFIV